MTTVDTDAINRRMAELQGYKYLKGIVGPDWFWFDRNQTKAHTFPPDYCHDPALTMPLMEAEQYMHIDRMADEDGQWFVALDVTSERSHYGHGPTILIAYCLAFIARADAGEKQG